MKKICFAFFILAFFLIFFKPQSLQAITVEECERNIGQLDLNEYKDCEQLFTDLYQKAADEKKSLQSEIKRFDALMAITTTKIYLTAKEIKVLEAEIAALSEKIGLLDISLNQLTELLIKRIAETYKRGKIDYLALFFSSHDFGEFVSRYKYLRVAQLNDRQLIIKLETARTNYDDQKTVKEVKQEELEQARKKLLSQKALLAQQKEDKERLLEITQNSQQRYQQLLAATRAEIDAIQRIIAGRGEEEEAGKVNQGDIIATIIGGASACSTGTHLHFEVREKDEVRNPLNHLKNIVFDNPYGDVAIATGNWFWPLNDPIILTQTFGSDTGFIRSGASWYNFHTGIDIVSSDRKVKTVQSGTLYRGSIACGSGTLRYVRMDHDNSDIDTYYLHVNY